MSKNEAGEWLAPGSVALVTGAGRGFGAGIARRLAAAGLRVVLVDRDGASVREVAAGLGPCAISLQADVTSLEAMEGVVAETVARFGRLDVVVANAGVTAFGSVEGMNPAMFRRVIDVNLVGVWNTLRAAIPAVRKQRGYLLVVCSLASAIHSPLQAHYTASKAGVEAIADSLRQELRDDGVAVGALYPTFAATDMMTEFHREEGASLLWGGNTGGPFGMVTPGQVVDGMWRAIRGRKRMVVVPRRLTPLVLAPGLVHRVIELLIRRYGGGAAIAAARRRESDMVTK